MKRSSRSEKNFFMIYKMADTPRLEKKKMAELRRRVKEIREKTKKTSISLAKLEDLQREIAEHEAVEKMKETIRKRTEALAKAREAKKEVVMAGRQDRKEKKVATKVKDAVAEAMKPKADPKPKAEKKESEKILVSKKSSVAVAEKESEKSKSKKKAKDVYTSDSE